MATELIEVIAMAKQRESAQQSKERIIKTARVLFAEYGINGVSIRQIAEQAEISHTLIISYFKSKENLAKEILQREIVKYAKLSELVPRQNLQDILNHTRTAMAEQISNPDLRTTIQLLVRAELDGFKPELMIDNNVERLTDRIASMIKANQKDEHLPDARLSAVVVMGAIFSLTCFYPWLLSAVGIPVEDFEKHKDGLVEVLMQILAHTTGISI
jgi:AcrR family transcriptional regulator